MICVEPVDPLGWAIARDGDGKPLYLVAVVMGGNNVEKFEAALQKIRPHMARVDTFDGTDGQPEDSH